MQTAEGEGDGDGGKERERREGSQQETTEERGNMLPWLPMGPQRSTFISNTKTLYPPLFASPGSHESSGDSWRVRTDAKYLICGVRGLFGRKEYDSTGKQNGELFSFKILVSYSQKINLFQIFDLRAWRLGNTVSFK